jgi:hypothetical protein
LSVLIHRAFVLGLDGLDLSREPADVAQRTPSFLALLRIVGDGSER